MGIEILGSLEIRKILTKLGPKEIAKVGCVNHYFQDWASDDSIWSQFCALELHLYFPEDPLGNRTPSFKEAYHAWRESFAMYPWSLVLRVRICWERIKSWLVVHFPEAVSTLRKGVTEDKLNHLEKCLGVKLPLPTRLLYRFCDGQDVVQEYNQNFSERLLGLIGGYSFTGYLVNVYLLPLDEVISMKDVVKRQCIQHVRSLIGTEYLVVAASSTENMKFFFLDCSTGELFVGARNVLDYGEISPCVPDDMIRSIHDVRDCEQQDGLLLWLEEHGRRLESGLVNVRKERNTRYICLFPEDPSLCYAAVSNGVQVRASAVFIPELSVTDFDSIKDCFTYSIRMSLKPEGCIINGMRFDSCQLYREHRIIRENDNVVSETIEETVVGKNPILHPGEKEFVYQGCIYISTSQGSIKGSYTFVPGRLTYPKGAMFEVALPQIFLQSLFEVPDYIF
ncbi:F-box protein SKIP16 [Heracleum sosnowskyi]|uniref:F-box protein SKIP16 n=1 Tax=Heracleum sosnowskyi TaxID=360622 RepID=A0AAD8MV12_9APIA|nr:F-box protein SKIP16 [Heracleum sosnowskyi]